MGLPYRKEESLGEETEIAVGKANGVEWAPTWEVCKEGTLGVAFQDGAVTGAVGRGWSP